VGETLSELIMTLILYVVLVFAFILVLVAMYLGWCWLSARMEVKAAPREPMFECEKHGVFRRKHLVKFLDNEYCPQCIDERLQKQGITKLDGTV
jgi:hypothetical protein